MDFFIEPEQINNTTTKYTSICKGKFGTITRKLIVDEKISKLLKKKVGEYISIICNNFSLYDNTTYDYLSRRVINNINELLDKKKYKKILVVGIGNDNIIADSLGPKTIDKIIVTGNFSSSSFANVWALSPSVLAKTGIATADIVKQITKLICPDIVILIDVLTCNNIMYLGKSIQLSTVITPGGGVGNKQPTINSKFLGCPTVVIGVPLIVNANTLGINREIYLTTKDIDEVVDIYSTIIANAINKFSHTNFSYKQLKNLIQR